jgi:hypothetical protein
VIGTVRGGVGYGSIYFVYFCWQILWIFWNKWLLAMVKDMRALTIGEDGCENGHKSIMMTSLCHRQMAE